MSDEANLHVADVGTVLRFACTDEAEQPLDLSTAETMTLRLEKPDGATVDHALALTTDGSDGLCQYVTAAEDLDQPGPWYWQVIVAFSSTRWHSQRQRVRVFTNLAAPEA